MEQEGPSFWEDIKKYEDTLERDPNSYCFAPLSELYRKLGMVDDAIIVAKRGCELHPEYVGGYMALGRAYHEKGMNAECRVALEKVVRVTPDNLLAQRILSQIYIDAGEITAAEMALQSILTQNPDDVESRILLNSLTSIAIVDKKTAIEANLFSDKPGDTVINETGSEVLSGQELEGLSPVPEYENGAREYEFLLDDNAEEIIELSESDIIEEPVFETEEIEGIHYQAQPDESTPDLCGGEMEQKDPLTTATLAELYVSQGFPERALAIYNELLSADPDNAELKSRLIAVELELKNGVAVAGEELVKADSPLQGAEEEPVVVVSQTLTQADADSADEILSKGDQRPDTSEEHIIHSLEMWLENIKRRR